MTFAALQKVTAVVALELIGLFLDQEVPTNQQVM
jgi:hypothetical protein